MVPTVAHRWWRRAGRRGAAHGLNAVPEGEEHAAVAEVPMPERAIIAAGVDASAAPELAVALPQPPIADRLSG